MLTSERGADFCAVGAPFGADFFAARFGADFFAARFGADFFAARFGADFFAARFGADFFAARFGADFFAARFGADFFAERFGADFFAARFGADFFAARLTFFDAAFFLLAIASLQRRRPLRKIGRLIRERSSMRLTKATQNRRARGTDNGAHAHLRGTAHEATISGVNSQLVKKHGVYVKLEYGDGSTVVWGQQFGKNHKPDAVR